VNPAFKEIVMNYTRVMLAPLFLVAVLFGSAGIASAAPPIVYVSALGLDSNTGGRTSPFRSITRALSIVQPRGEVIVLDCGDYDEFTVSKSVTVETAPEVTAVIPALAHSSVGILVSAPSTATVVLRGLTITTCGGGGNYGIQSSGGTLLVENCVIDGIGSFSYGIQANNTTLFVRDTAVLSTAYGIYVSSSSVATIERCRIEQNNDGLFVGNNSKATVRDTVTSGNSGSGMYAAASTGNTSELNVEHCAMSGNSYGIFTDNFAGGTVIARVADSVATDNSWGFYNAGTTFYTWGNNTLGGNTSGDFSGPLTSLATY
jgi:parallel beta-helix repeat protein